MTETGASAAYRGYRLQALYILERLLTPGIERTLAFHPEGYEDLGIKENDVLKEAIQVKSYDGLILSNLSPEKENSFLRRALRLMDTDENTRIRLVNFGPIGNEMTKAWGDKKNNEENGIYKKLRGFGYSNEEIAKILNNVKLVEVSEDNVRTLVFSRLQEQLTGIDPVSAFDLLNYWLYIQSENKGTILYSDAIIKVQNVGRFINEMHTHHQEWFTSIEPFDDYPISEERFELLRTEFFSGVSTRYEHILAKLDFPREQKTKAIDDGFHRKNIVLIHAASGQGKSTIAYRYLYDTYPQGLRFSIKVIENRQHALKIATALVSHANALQAPMIVFIDVSPGDVGWPELVKQLSYQPYLKILVTVREEDLQRANVADVFDYVSIDLSFDEDEARLIYERAKGIEPLAQLTFDDAWHTFGGDGPLLEFVYLLVQTETLQTRLEGQINRIRQEVREKHLSPDELRFLWLISVGTAYDVQIHLPTLLNTLQLPEPSLTIQFFEKEYLLRVSSSGEFISGLHPIRSKILTHLLSDPVMFPWIEAVRYVLPMVEENEWESFLLQSFTDHSNDVNEIIKLIMDLKPRSWAGVAGIIYTLIWAGIKSYTQENSQPIEAAYDLLGKGWYIALDINFIGDDGISTDDWWSNMRELLPTERRERIEQIRQSQSPKDKVFQYALQWFDSINYQLTSPDNYRDWHFAPAVFYWSYRFKLTEKVVTWLSNDVLSLANANLLLADFSKLVLGYYLLSKNLYLDWMANNRNIIEQRLAEEYGVVALEEKDDTIRLHYLTYPENSSDDVKLSIHDRTMERVEILRQLFPNYEKFGSQGYGHQFKQLGLQHDETTKTGIVKRYLVLQWSRQVNTIAQGLIRYNLRPNGWEDYLSTVLEFRKQIVLCLLPLVKGISKYFSRDDPVNLLELDVIQGGAWDECKNAIDNAPTLPKVAVDPWGIAPPENNSSDDVTNDLQKLLPLSVTSQVYKPYFKFALEYLTSMSNYLEQAIHVMATNFRTGKLMDGLPQKDAILEQLRQNAIKTDLAGLSVFNFFEAKSVLSDYQTSFRSLFAHRIDSDKLTNLENEEREALNQLWPFWHTFAYYPRTALSNPSRQIPARLEGAMQAFLYIIDETIREFQVDGITAFRLDEIHDWNDEASIWIRLDITDLTAIYAKVEELILALRKAIGSPSPSELIYYGIKDYFKYFIFVPTIRKKMWNSFIWPLRTEFTLLSDDPIESKVWAYVPKTIPAFVAEQLGLTTWQHDDISSANDFSASIVTLQTILSLISNIKGMPDTTNAGTQKTQVFMEARSKELSEVLQLFIDSGQKLLDKFQSLPDDEKEARPYLIKAMILLSEIHAKTLPSENFNKQESLNLEAIEQYAQQLQEILPYVEQIRLFWIADTIDNELRK